MSDEVKKIGDLATISDERKAAMGVSALSDTPNRTSRYGTGNLTATELKNWFDQLVGLAIQRINEIITVLQDGDLANEIPIDRLGTISTVQGLADAVTSGDLWEKLTIAYTDSEGEDATMLASAKIAAIEAEFLKYVSSVEYDTTEHKIKISKGGSETKEAIDTVIVDKAYFDALIDDYAKLNDATQDITAQNITANYVQAETPDGDGDLDKYLVNLKTLNAALKNITDKVATDIASAVSSVYVYKGSKPTFEELPKNAVNGHVYNVTTEYEGHPAGTNYVWSDGGWEVLTGSIDTSKFVEKLSGTKLVYTVGSDGNSSSIGYDESATKNTIPVRDSAGRIKTLTPDADTDAANKGYVDARLGTKADLVDPYTDAPYTIGARTDTMGNAKIAVDFGGKLGEPTVPLYSAEGRLSCANPSVGTDAVNLGYLNGVIGNLAGILETLHSGSGGTV